MRLLSFIRAMLYTAAGVFMLLSLPFVVEHVQRNWDAPAYPHTGFCPESPTWEEPADAPAELWRGKRAEVAAEGQRGKRAK